MKSEHCSVALHSSLTIHLLCSAGSQPRARRAARITRSIRFASVTSSFCKTEQMKASAGSDTTNVLAQHCAVGRLGEPSPAAAPAHLVWTLRGVPHFWGWGSAGMDWLQSQDHNRRWGRDSLLAPGSGTDGMARPRPAVLQLMATDSRHAQH